ncbi:MAG: alpha-ketoglutarate-dependent dioxygenase AlkB [Deltaproteobacteria bacterium]|nr:alpha-ketoglutarate-dependent dioxygenase AlkB [Deltaproteobacteria bacterium]
MSITGPSWQPSLLAIGPPSFDPGFQGVAREELADGAWIERLPRWLLGDGALLDALWASTRWRVQERPMYDRVVAVPRLTAGLPADGPGHPLVDAMGRALSLRYGVPFDRVGLACYRDGRDSVAWHGDYVGRTQDEALVATVSLGERRRFLLRPAGGGRSRAFQLGWGDLFVMGGSCQRTWEHAVPKVARAGARLSIMFRSSAHFGAWRPS